MAKWGEGDPRWIVEERADATNVNNWHWTEKNATNWSKDKLRSLLTGLEIEGAAGVAELKDFATLEGEASASNRKRKLIFFYEWDIKINWKGLVNTESQDEVSGTISIPNLSDEQDIDDIEVNVAVTDKTPCSSAHILKEMVRTRGADLIREKLASYVDLLKLEFSQGMILPTAEPTSNNQPASASTNLAKEFKQTCISGGATTPNSSTTPTKSPVVNTGVKISTKKISMKEEFMCAKEELYRALTEQNMVQAFTRAPVTRWDLEVGGKFILFNGMISGEFQQLVPHDTIVKRWRMKDWPDGHYSVVTLKLSQSSNSTTLTLSQTGVPSSETDKTKQGWLNYYFNSIKQTFGFAVNLF